jgi:hypothetical protein
MKQNQNIKWHFENGSQGGEFNGINNPGIQSYMSAKIQSLAREICQNSLDASREPLPQTSQPVRVEFSYFELSPAEILDHPSLIEVYDAIVRTFKELKKNDSSEVDFAEKAKRIMNSSRIPCLRISDYNTRGLRGSNDDLKGDWRNLVKAMGISDKSGTAGGSFGIGKNAVFTVSNAYQVFYSTIDDQGHEAFQGVTRLPSYFLNGDTKRGTGYYGYGEKFRHIPEWRSLDPNFVKREEPGTDIFIMAFDAVQDWREEIVTAIIENFMVSILERRLVVDVDSIRIDDQSIETIIKQQCEAGQSSLALEYYYAYKESIERETRYTYSIFSDNDVELRLHYNDEENDMPVHSRKVSVCRQNGMKIFDRGHISTSIDFAGVLILRGDKVNKFFRKLETPQHDRWSFDYADDSKKAKKMEKKLFDFVREKVRMHIEKGLYDDEDPEGIADFLPDLEIDEGNRKLAETLNDFRIRQLKVNSSQIITRKESQGDQTKKREIISGEQMEGGDIIVESSSNRGRKRKKRTIHVPGIEKDKRSEAIKLVKSSPQFVRLIKIDKGYKVIAKFHHSPADFVVNLSYLGETNDRLPVNIHNVITSMKNQYDAKGIRFFNQKMENTVSFIVETYQKENWSIGVDIYEIKRA